MPPELSRSGSPITAFNVEALGAAVRETRKAYGVSQSELAGLAGTGLRFISELERGKPSVTLDKVLAVLALQLYVVRAGPLAES